MPSFRYQFAGFELTPLGFHREDMSRVGAVALDSERDRITRGLNVDDLPALPLSAGYRKQKLKAGKQARRDWNFTGDALRTMQAQAGDGQASIEFAGGGQKLAALGRWNANREQMAGLSPSDQAKVTAAQEEIFRAKVNGHE